MLLEQGLYLRVDDLHNGFKPLSPQSGGLRPTASGERSPWLRLRVALPLATAITTTPLLINLPIAAVTNNLRNGHMRHTVVRGRRGGLRVQHLGRLPMQPTSARHGLDTVYVPRGAPSCDALFHYAHSQLCLKEAYKHGKAISATADGGLLIDKAAASAATQSGAFQGARVIAASGKMINVFFERFITAIAKQPVVGRTELDAIGLINCCGGRQPFR